MADEPVPTKPRQPIEDTSGYVVLEDGRRVPTLDTWFNQQGAGVPGFGVAEQRTKLGQQYKTGAQAVTDALGNFAAAPDLLASKVGLVTPSEAEQRQRDASWAASFFVPQTLTQAAIMGGMSVAGGATSALGAGRALTNTATVLGGTAGGAVGGKLEYGTNTAALTGAGQGLVESGMAVTASELLDLARRIGPARVRRQMNMQAAEQVGQALEQMPSLKGVFAGIRDERGLRDLALGTVEETLPNGMKVARQKGNYLLSQAAEKYNADVSKLIPPDYGPKFPDAMSPGTFTTWNGARRSMSELGRRAFGTGAERAALEPSLKNVDLKQLWKETSRAIQRQLTDADPTGQALRTYLEGQQLQESGRAVLKAVRAGFTGEKGAQRPWYNHDAVMSLLGNKQAYYQTKLPVEDFWQFANAHNLNRQTIGQVDVFQPHGALANVAGVIPGPMGGYASVHGGWPDLVGNRTDMSGTGRTLFQLGTAQGLSNLGNPLNEAMQGPGVTIPGLGR